MDQAKTAPAMLLRALRESPRRVFLRVIDAKEPTKDPISWTYEDFGLEIRKTIAFLQNEGISQGKRLVILAENSPEWQVLALAGQCLRAEVVALFATLGPLDVAGIVERVRPSLAVVSNRDQLEKLLSVSEKLGDLKRIVTLEAGTELPPPWRGQSFQEISRLAPISMEALGKLVEAVHAEDIFMLNFTSGTTGRFKGVRVAHRAFLASLEGGAITLDLKPENCCLLVLPFGHVAGQCNFYVALKQQTSLIFCPNRKALFPAFAQGPTHMLLVPFFYERLYGELRKTIEGKPKWAAALLKSLMEATTRVGSGEAYRLGDRAQTCLATILLGRKLKKKLGGKLRAMVSVGASVDNQMIGFFRGLGFELLNYYGMSETAGTIALDSVLDPVKKIGSTGRPWQRVEVRITEEGEIVIRGQTLFSGYLEKEDEAGAFTEDGFFRTGDLGRIDEDGYLFVTGRKKNLLVLRTGEKVASEAVELQLQKILPIEGAVALGNNEPFVVAAVFVSKENLKSLKEEVGDQRVENFFLEEIQKGFSGMTDFTVPERVLIIPGIPADYPDLVTPTLKIKRDKFLARFRDEIDGIYGRRRGPGG